MHYEDFLIDPERLRNRLKFLEIRAEFHTKYRQQRYEHQAIAATAYRDAASIALFLEDSGLARKLLHKAGVGYLELGLIHGVVLLALSGGPKAASLLSDHTNLIDSVRNQSRLISEEEHRKWPLENSARTTTSQLLALYQADCLDVESLGKESTEVPYRQALDRRSGFQVGLTGLSIESYVRVSQMLIGPTEGKLKPDHSFISRIIETIVGIRVEAIQSAMKDSYHWQRLPRPSALLDFDTLVLSYLALSNDFGLGPFERFLGDGVPFLGAPIRAAKLLQQGPEQKPLQRY